MTDDAPPAAHEAEPEPDDTEHELDADEVDPEEVEELDAEELDELQEADAPSSTAIVAALERENTRHGRAIAKALGLAPDELHACPTCEGVGYTPELQEAEPELVQDPFTETCERCRGNGQTKSGATALGLAVIPCNGCGGSGYVTKPEQPTIGSVPPNGAPTVIAGGPPVVTSPADAALAAELRSKGYTIVEPIDVPAPAPA